MMRWPAPVWILAFGAGCSPGSEPLDPLDRELIAELATAQGSASGDARSGAFTIAFTTDSCDCPSVEFDAQTIDLCTLVSLGELPAELVEGSGFLGISNEGLALLLTGAIESDGSFIVAGTQDISTLASPLEALRRMDGQFSPSNDLAEGWAGQRLLGELATQAIDCRWTGSFVATRN